MNNNPKMNIFVELFEEYDRVSLYTIRKSNNRYSETEFFFREFSQNEKFRFEIDVILNVIEKFNEEGVLLRRLRPEGGNIFAIPITVSRLRLYLFIINSSVIVLGNGGEKKSRTYQEDANLNQVVLEIKEVAKQISRRIRSGEIQVLEKEIIGNLEFQCSIN
jgi:hypothetical protein